jgi:hypothetical protein
MPRLCGESSRSYPGRPVRLAVAVLTAPCMATYRVIGQESAEAILGVDTVNDGMTVGNEPRPAHVRRTSRRSHPTEGPNAKNSSVSHVPWYAMNPNGGATKQARHGKSMLLMIKKRLPSAFQRTVFGSFSRLRLGIFANRPVRTRMPGGVGAGG